MNDEIFRIFFHEKPAKMLIDMKNSKGMIYGSTLAKHVDCTYSHVVKILQMMEKNGLVTFGRQGRLKLLTLTKKGNDVADHIERVRNLL
jgi:DNA-binding MarR family transcriptional regulator